MRHIRLVSVSFNYNEYYFQVNHTPVSPTIELQFHLLDGYLQLIGKG